MATLSLPIQGMAGGETITIPVTGMTCAGCQAGVQRALQRTPGVEDATVSLMTGSAAVRFDPAATTPQALVEAILATGYGAELPRPERTAFDEQAARDDSEEEEFHSLRRRALVSGAVGALAMILSMPLMTSGAHAAHAANTTVADPFMRWAMKSMTPGAARGSPPWLYRIDPGILSWLLLVLTLGVMAWAGRHFYTRAWKASSTTPRT